MGTKVFHIVFHTVYLLDLFTKTRFMKCTFRLKDVNKEGETSIFLDIVHNNGRKSYGVGRSIHPKLWDNDKQRPTTKNSTIRKYEKSDVSLRTRLKNIKTELDDVERAVENYEAEARLKGRPLSAQGLKDYLSSKLKGESNQSQTPFFTTYFEDYYLPKLEDGSITYISQGIRKRYADATIKTKTRALKAFKKYEDKVLKRKIKFEDIDIKWHKDFVDKLEDQGKKTNYIGSLIKEVKVILRRTYQDGLHTNRIFEHRDFVTLTEKTTEIYLTQEELNKLEALPLEGKDKAYRDAFLIGCYTAMRFSDYSKLDLSYISSCGKNIENYHKKTGTKVVIPLHPFIKNTLNDEKYQNKGKLYNQKLNKKIKKFAEDAGITNMVKMKTTTKGKHVYESVPKHTMITTHTARRTGATLLYLDNIPLSDIMKITGHTSEMNLMKYIRVSEEETAQRLAKSNFFNP